VVVAGLVIGGVAAAGPASGAGPKGTALPQPRADMAMAPDRNGNIVMFGGYDGNYVNMPADTWTWDGLAWTEQHPTSHPVGRCCHGMAYDEARQQTVLFGGTDFHGEFEDTWTWDGKNWTKQHPGHSPPGASSFALVYDSARQQVLAFMGIGIDAAPWAWDGSDWIELPAPVQPEHRYSEEFAYDSARRRTVIFGGEACFDDCTYFKDTWTWDGRVWAQEQPDSNARFISGGAMAYDPLRRQAVLFGGHQTFIWLLRDTWIWDGTSWKRLHPSDAPSAREGQAMAWQEATDQIVLFGGRDYPANTVRYWNDTWTWDGSTWTEH
jgi:hypothetical protein